MTHNCAPCAPPNYPEFAVPLPILYCAKYLWVLCPTTGPLPLYLQPSHYFSQTCWVPAKLQSLCYGLCSETQDDELHCRAHHARHLPIDPLKIHNSQFNIHSRVARIEPLSQSYLRKAHFHVVRQCFRTEQSQTTYLLHPDNVPCHPASQHVPFWGSGGALRRPQASHVHTAAPPPVAAFDTQVFGFAKIN